MSKELQTIQRQVLETSGKLPTNTAFSQMQGAFNAIAGVSGRIAGDLAAKRASELGAQAGQEELGKPRKLAPSLGKATAAFNNSYNNVQTSLHSNELQGILSNIGVEVTSPGRLNPNSTSEYFSLSKSAIDGYLEGVAPQNRADVALHANAILSRQGVRVAQQVQAFNDKKIADSLNLAFQDNLEALRDDILTGRVSDQKVALSNIKQSIQDYKNLSNITPSEAIRLERQAQQVLVNSKLEKGYRDAGIKDGEQGEIKFISEFFSDKPDDLSLVQYETAKDFLLNLNTKNTKELNVVSSRGYANILNEFLRSPENFGSVEDVDRAIQEQSDKGFPLNLAQQNDLLNRTKSANKKAASRAATNQAIFSAIQNKDVGIVDFTDTELNHFYQDASNAQKLNRDNLVAQGDLAEGQLPDWQIEANIAASMPVPVPSFTNQLNAKLTNKNLMNLDEAIRQYGYLKDRNPESLSDLPKETKAFADTMLQEILNAGPGANLEAIYDDNAEAVLNPNRDLVNLRVANHKQQVKDRPTQNDKNIRKAFNIRGGLFGADIPDDMRVQYDRLLERNAKLYETKNYDMAIKATIDELKETYKDSPKFAPKGRPVPNPVENLPFYGLGNNVENQGAKMLEEIVLGQPQFNDELPAKIARSDKMPDFPATMSDDEKFSGQFAKNGYWLNIDGKDRRIHFISPNFRKMDPFAPNVYQLFYDKDGQLKPLKTFQRQADGTMMLNTTMATFFPPSVYMPELMAQMDADMAETGLNEAAENRIKAANPIELKDFQFPVRPGSGAKGIAELKELLERRNVEIETSREALKQEIQLSIDLERRRRLREDQEEEDGG